MNLSRLLPIRRFSVEGESMNPGYRQGERLIISPILLKISLLKEGDVVVIQHPKDSGKQILKRVIGIPGDRIEGVELETGDYFVLGDNKSKSEDSRRFGKISKSQIIGKVWFKY